MFSERLKDLMKKEGYTTKALGERIGITGSALSMMLTGKRKPSYESLKALCDVLHTNPNYLMGYSEEISDQDRQLLKAFKAMAQNATNANQTQNPVIQTKTKENER